MARRPRPTGKRLGRALEHARKVVAALPGAETWLAAMRALRMKPDEALAGLAERVADGEAVTGRAALAARRLEVAWAAAKAEAGEAYAWQGGVRSHLRAAREVGGEGSAEAVREVRTMLQLRSARFGPGLALLRTVLPALRAREARLEVYDGAGNVRRVGDELLDRMEAREVELVRVEEQAEASLEEARATTASLEDGVDRLAAAWDVARRFTADMPAWPCGQSPWKRRTRGNGKRRVTGAPPTLALVAPPAEEPAGEEPADGEDGGASGVK